MQKPPLRGITLLLSLLALLSASADALEVRGQNSIGIFNKITDNEAPRSGVGTQWGEQDHRGFSSTHRFRLSASVFAVQNITITGSNPDNFAISSTITTLQSSQTAEFTVTFAPIQIGETSAEISIEFQENGAQTKFTLNVEGTGTGPEIAVFGGGGQVIPVPDGDTAPDEIKGTDFGRRQLTAGAHSNTFTIRNTGTDTLSIPIDSLNAQGDGFGFSFSSDDFETIKIEPAENYQFTISFNPSAEGIVNGTFSFGTDAPFPRNFFSFALRGNGVVQDKPRATVLGGTPPQILGSDGTAPPSAESGTIFPDTFPRATSTKTFTIRNDGDGDLTFPQVPDVGAPFDIANPGSFDTATPLAPGETRSFDVVYQPTEPAPFSNATVRVSSNDPDTGNYFFRVRGSSTAPTEPAPLQVTGDTNFGTIVEFTPSPPRIFTVTNIGGEELTIDQISIPFADAFFTQEFEPTKIQPEEQIEFPVWLNSENINGGRRYTTTVSIRVTKPKFAPVTLGLVATVIEAPDPPSILAVSREGTELVLQIALGPTSYRVERSDNLETWAPAPGLQGQTSTELRIPDAAPNRFFRLVAEF